MIDKKALSDFIEKKLEGTGLYLVELTVSPDNRIVVEVDSDSSVDIDKCVELTREIESEFDRDVEDYELEVGSAGLTSPFKVRRQYEKNIGNEVEVLTRGGEKLSGVLKSVDDGGFVIETEVKVKPEGAKRPVMEKRDRSFGFDEVKYTRYLLKF